MSILEDQTVLEVLQKSVAAAVAASDTPSLPVKYVGRSWAPPDDQKWLELVFIPNDRDDFWGDERNYQGLFRLILHWPNDDSGAYLPMKTLRSVASYFVKGPLLQGVQISATPALTGVLEQGSENLYPASLRYQWFRQ